MRTLRLALMLVLAAMALAAQKVWDGTKWVAQTDWFADYTGLVGTLVKANSADYAKAAK